MQRLKNKVAIVTGRSSGMAIALRFSHEGAPMIESLKPIGRTGILSAGGGAVIVPPTPVSLPDDSAPDVPYLIGRTAGISMREDVLSKDRG